MDLEIGAHVTHTQDEQSRGVVVRLLEPEGPWSRAAVVLWATTPIWFASGPWSPQSQHGLDFLRALPALEALAGIQCDQPPPDRP